MGLTRCLVLSAAVLLMAVGQARAAIITLTYDETASSYSGHQSHPVLDGVDHTVIGFTYSASGSYGGTSTTTSNYGQMDPNTVLLKWTMSQAHAGLDWTDVYSYSRTRFIADLDSLSYEIGGRHAVDGVAGPPYVSSFVDFRDITSGETLFSNYNTSRARLNVVHIIGVGGGDQGSAINGSLTGSLILGHEYELISLAWIGRTDRFTEGGAVGSGFYSLKIGVANLSPVADAGESHTVHCTSPSGAMVTLDGSSSSDPDGDDLEYVWSVAENSGIVLDNTDPEHPIGTFPVGVHEVTLIVYDLDENGDRKGTMDVTSVIIEVVDDDPPVALVTTDLAALQPANNKMIPVTVIVQASDECTDPNDLLMYCTVSSSQPDDTDGTSERVGDVGGRDGYTSPVQVILVSVGDGLYRGVINLRAEREGAVKEGRTYSIRLDVMDGSGNMKSASTAVVVPHSGKKN